MSDLRYALRTLLKSPGFTTIAVLTLALGIGANTAMFAVVNALLLKPLPFPDADRLMLVHLLAPDRQAGPGAFRETVWSYPKYETFAKLQEPFDATALFSAREISLTNVDEPESLRGEVVAGAYFRALGVVPVAGRTLLADESRRPGGPPIAVIGHGLWSRRFGADPGIVGRTIHLNAVPHTVVGVLPRGFRGLSGAPDVWVTVATFDADVMTERQNHRYLLVARRKESVTEQTAVAAMRVAGRQVDAEFGNTGWGGATAISLYASRVDADIRRSAIVLLAAVGFVLLIACVNLTNVLLARAVARRREVAVRLAIGASRGRIARQFLVETLMVAGLGAAAGLLMAVALLDLGSGLLPESDVFFRAGPETTRRIAGAAGLTRIGAGMIHLDVVTFFFTAGVAIVTALAVGVLPAFQASASRPVDALRASGAAASHGGRGYGVRALLVVGETALALVLLVGAGLMIKSFTRLQSTSLGVVPDHVVTVRLRLPAARYDAAASALLVDQLLQRLRNTPGVEAVSVGNCAPVSGGCGATVMSTGQSGHLLSGLDPVVGTVYVTADLPRTLAIRLLRGRTFTEQDRPDRPKVALVNEVAARAFWPNQDPVGKRILVGLNEFKGGAEIVGVVSNVRYRSIEAPPQPDVYVAYFQAPRRDPMLFVRSRLDSRTLVAAIGREVRALDPNIPLTDVKTMDERIGDASWRTRLSALLLALFAALALFLTAIGIFGVLAQLVAQRTREIGIRMALGARSADVVWLVGSRGVALTAAGIAIGLALAAALARVLTTLLYEVKPDDPSTFGFVALLLIVVAFVACYLPACRAARVDPVVALRTE